MEAQTDMHNTDIGVKKGIAKSAFTTLPCVLTYECKIVLQNNYKSAIYKIPYNNSMPKYNDDAGWSVMKTPSEHDQLLWWQRNSAVWLSPKYRTNIATPFEKE